MTKSVLIVDDEEYILRSLSILLEEENYNIFTSQDALKAFEILEKEKIDLIISDYRMPKMNGVEFMKKVHQSYTNILFMMLTGYADIDAIISLINEGSIFKYITKPWNDEELLKTINDAFTKIENQNIHNSLEKNSNIEADKLKTINQNLQKSYEGLIYKEKQYKKLFNYLEKNFFEAINLTIMVIEKNYPDLSRHLYTTRNLSNKLSKQLKLSSNEIKDIELAAFLHDIGKLRLPDVILSTNDDDLNFEQKELLKHHTVYGSSMLSSIEKLKNVSNIILHHHELLNGTGYPFGKKSNDIPFESKIIRIVDTVDIEIKKNKLNETPQNYHDVIEKLEETEGEITLDSNILKTMKKMFIV